MPSTNAPQESDHLKSIFEAELLAKQTELRVLSRQIRIEELVASQLCVQVDKKRLEARELSSSWIERASALHSKRKEEELLQEDIRLQEAYLEKLRDVEIKSGKLYTREEYLQKENLEMEVEVKSLREALDATKTSMGKDFNRLQRDFNALAIIHRDASAKHKQKIDKLEKGKIELLELNRNSISVIHQTREDADRSCQENLAEASLRGPG